MSAKTTVTLVNTGKSRIKIRHLDGDDAETFDLPPNPGGVGLAARVQVPKSVLDRKDWRHLQSQGVISL